MSVRGHLVGFVTKCEIFQPSASEKKPFLSVMVESWNKFGKFPTRTKLMFFCKDLEAKKAEIPVGSLIHAEGDVSAEGYISNKGQSAGKAIAVLRMYCTMLETIDISGGHGGGGQPDYRDRAVARPPAPRPAPRQAPAQQPMAGSADDDVPF